jgi:hypothetical protein
MVGTRMVALRPAGPPSIERCGELSNVSNTPPLARAPKRSLIDTRRIDPSARGFRASVNAA